MHEDTLIDIEMKYQSLSKGHKRLADFILSNYDKVIFMTVHELSVAVGTSESTVVRFAHSLGHAGFPSFQKHLQNAIKTKLTTLQRLEHTQEIVGEKNVIKEIMRQDILNIQKTINNLSSESMKSIAQSILAANNVFIVGFRSSKVLAEYLAFYLKFMHPNVKLVPVGANDVYEEIINANSHDLVIAISFPRYSKLTIDLVDILKKRKVGVIGLTDSYQSPLAHRVSRIITAEFNFETFVDSLTAPMSLVNALIIAVSQFCEEDLQKKFDLLEDIWSENKVYL
jgi:DNA-binding MurR/RpiR family transcriptional regulator